MGGYWINTHTLSYIKKMTNQKIKMETTPVTNNKNVNYPRIN